MSATKACIICLKNGHPTDICPLMQEETVALEAVRGYEQRNFYQQNIQGWSGNY